MNPDRRPLLDRRAPVLSIERPYDYVRVDGTKRRDARDVAERATNRFASLTAVQVGELIRRVFGRTAERVLFERREGSDGGVGDIHLDLLAVYDDEQVLWYDPCGGMRGTLAVRDRDEIEAYGGPVLPELDADTQKAIEMLATVADDKGDGWFALTALVVGRTVRDGEMVDVVYDGDVCELDIAEEQRHAEWVAQRRREGVEVDSITFDRLAELLRRESAVLDPQDVDSLVATLRVGAGDTPKLVPLVEPLGRADVARLAVDGRLTVVVEVELSAVVELAAEFYNDLLCDAVIGDATALAGISDRAVGVADGGRKLLIEVSGDVTDWLAED
ncbi:hypothetical protein OHQ88_34275 (plasmid) [Micromonospora zamorensis]|uniref:hypothetical protein n=1 Tax=Micromonospora zamorensis TaxID=709883 RepID=UPI002E23DBBC